MLHRLHPLLFFAAEKRSRLVAFLSARPPYTENTSLYLLANRSRVFSQFPSSIALQFNALCGLTICITPVFGPSQSGSP